MDILNRRTTKKAISKKRQMKKTINKGNNNIYIYIFLKYYNNYRLIKYQYL